MDSEDPPLDISQETLQQNKILRVIKKNLVKKCPEILAEIAETKDDYKTFYEQFVECMELGIHKNSVDDFEIAEQLQLITSMSGDEQISLKKYIDRKKEGQYDIHYITGESIAVVSSSPFLSLKICARKVLRYIKWWFPWLNIQCNRSMNSTERS